jgi:NAD(P)-dependent dehydrogenase (short-subunit alcohol dehydrogenase family)
MRRHQVFEQLWTDGERSAVDFDGQVALVAGGGSGIGRSTAELLAGRGARVAVLDLVESDLPGEMSELAALPNVVAKVPGPVTDAGPQWTVDDLRPGVHVALAAFGPARLVFGTDWPGCLLAASYDEVRDAGERAQVLGGTATRVYRLRRR